MVVSIQKTAVGADGTPPSALGFGNNQNNFQQQLYPSGEP